MEKPAADSGPVEDAITEDSPIAVENGAANSDRMALSTLRLQALNLALCISLFLSSLDSTIVSTALVPITNSLNGFNQSSWVVNAYLLTYTGFLIITAKLSDIFGRRAILGLSLIIFTIASIGCGVAQTLTQLIIFRAFQGIGGSGLYTMVFVVLPEMCTPAQYTLYSAIVSSVSVFSSLLGPILGGVISEETTWRWIFWINIPCGILNMALLYLAIPSHFPYAKSSDAPKLSWHAIHRLDLVGTCLLLAASTLLLTALEEGGIGHSWHSALVLVPLIFGLLLWCALFGWSRFQVSRNMIQEPILPWRVLTNRFCLALFFAAFWVGSILYSAVVALPQRFQVVHRTSAFTAGYRLLPLTLLVPVGSAVGASLMQKRHIPPFYLILAGAVLQALGVGLMLLLATDSQHYPASGYGFEVICGFGIGMNTAVTILSAMLVFEPRDLSIGMGGLGQFRSLGGAIGVSVCTNIINKYFTDDLSSRVTKEQMAAIRLSAKAIDTLPVNIQKIIRQSYAQGFSQQAIAMTAFGAAGILTVFLMVEKKLRRQM